MLVMFVAALWFLHLELQKYSLEEFKQGLLRIPAWNLVLAILFTLLNYAILVCYDWLGIWYIRHPMKFGRVALASFLGYSVGNNFGLLFGGSTIRYRLYSTWGLSAAEIVKLLFILAISFWIGLFALSGVVFLIEPLPIPAVIQLPMQTTRPLGIFLTSLAIIYLVICAIGKPLGVGKKRFSPPPVALSVMQYIVASVDLLVAAAIVYVLLPESIETSYFHFVAIFLLAQVAVFVTQVPGGLGVLELSLITLLAPTDDVKAQLFGSLLAYRLIFYLTPMMIGITMLGVNEVVTQRKHLSRVFGSLSQWTPDTAPRIAALIVFLCGICMLFTSALPVEAAKMQQLNSWLPLWFIELSYFLVAVFGVLLLLLSRGLYRRIGLAYSLTIQALVFSVFLTLASSLGYLQAAFLFVCLIVLIPIGHLFHRRGKLITDHIAYHWLIAITVVLLLTVSLYSFAYKKEADLAFDIWRVALDADAPRSLRAIIGAVAITLGFYIVRVLQISVGRPESTTAGELRVAQKIVAASTQPNANLALLGDKRLLFNEAETALVSYGIHGKSCVALGNPIGAPDDVVQLAWDFRELSEQQDLWPVFYLIDERYVSLYQEMSLRLFHVSDEAVVNLRQFDFDQEAIKPVAESERLVLELGYELSLIDGDAVDAVIPDLERVASAWQNDRGGPEYGFSISFFNAEFIKKNPVAIVRLEDRIVGFASVWKGNAHEEMTADLIRYNPECPSATLDFIFAQLIRIGQQEGFSFFSLGMAPLATHHSQQHIELSSQLMSLGFRFSKHFYSYQGLRNFKDRFHPDWRPAYLASSKDKPLSVIISDVSALIGSGETMESPAKSWLASKLSD